jgi:hypothetical protein
MKQHFKQTSTIERDVRNTNRTANLYLYPGIAGIIACCIVICFTNRFTPSMNIFMTILVLLSCAGVGIGIIASFRWNRTLRETIASEDIRAIGLLVEAMALRAMWSKHPLSRPRNWSGFDLLCSQATDLLIRKLPELQAGDAHLLTSDERKNLYEALKTDDSPLIRAILLALPQIGDRQALPYVAKLASGQWKASQDKQVQEAAQACLLCLQERIEGQASSQTLVRPAGSPAAPSKVLLRPAAGASDTNQDQLLRPTESAQQYPKSSS